MAKLVFAAGLSHGPMLALPPEQWFDRAKDETSNPEAVINKLDGSFVSYAEYYAEIGDRYLDQATLENFRSQSSTCRQALERLADGLAGARPDVVMIIGNDQRELFTTENFPALAIYCGDELATYRRRPEGMPAWRVAVSRAYAMDVVRRFRGAPEQALDVIGSLIRAGFDVTACHNIADPEELGFGHAYGFVANRIFREVEYPLLPVLLNTFQPPNIPTAGRCFDLGVALGEAIESLPDGLRVAAIASGGLSHFVVEEEFDRRVIEAILARDRDLLAALPEESLTSGTSETRSWIALAGLVGALEHEWLQYVPIRRTPAGTGQGMAFAVWQ